MNRLRSEFAGLRPTPLAKALGIVALGAGLYGYLLLLIWCAS